jgi:hypothetical protein
MIFTALNQTIIYRMHVPKWAVAPTGLVLYVDQFDEDDRIGVIDPAGMLPKNQESWS